MDFELAAEARETSGRVHSRRLRREGKIPAIVYGGGAEPSSITVDHNAVLHQMEQEAFYTSILTIKIGKQSQQVVLKAVQRHPAKPHLMHLDFQRIVANEAITLQVPIHFLNEETSVGVKGEGGIAEHLQTDVEVSCLPKDLPEYIELDVEAVTLGQILHLSDLKLPAGVSLVALEHGSDQAVFAIHAPRRAEETETTETDAADAATPEAGGDAAAEDK